MAGRDQLIDAIIGKAIEDGKFDNLAGKGKPLDLKSNAFADPAWRTAFDILSKQGFVLPWMEKRNEIEAQFERGVQALSRSWAWRVEKLAEGYSAVDYIEGEWRRAKESFEELLLKLNKQIADYNLEVPADVFLRNKINFAQELARVESIK